MAVSIQIESNARQVMQTMRALPSKMARGIAMAINLQNDNTVTMTIEKRMNFSKQGPVITGSLRRQSGMAVKSLRVVPAEVSQNSVTGSFGSNLVYVKAHELGYQGTVNVRGHMRRQFKYGTQRKEVFDFLTREKVVRDVTTRRVIKVRGPGGKKRDLEHYVRAHTMRMNLPARHMIGETFALRVPSYASSISAAILDAWNGREGTLQPVPIDRGAYNP